MHNNYHILIYERAEEVSIEETNKYLDKIKDETKAFPDLYKNIILEYQNNL